MELPLAVYSFLNTTTASIPKLALSSRMGETALGIYGPVTQPVVLLQVGATYLFNPFITVFADSYARRDKKGFFKAVFAVQGIVLALLPLGLAVAHFLGRWGLALLFGQAILPYAFLLLPVLGSTLCISLIYFFEVPLTIGRRLKVMTAIHGGAVVVAAAVSLLAIPAQGLQGVLLALYASAGCDVLAMAAVTAWMCRKAETPA